MFTVHTTKGLSEMENCNGISTKAIYTVIHNFIDVIKVDGLYRITVINNSCAVNVLIN